MTRGQGLVKSGLQNAATPLSGLNPCSRGAPKPGRHRSRRVLCALLTYGVLLSNAKNKEFGQSSSSPRPQGGEIKMMVKQRTGDLACMSKSKSYHHT